MQVQTIPLDDDSITLGQLLQVLGLTGSGGQAKWFLKDYEVLVNQVPENRRGRKLYSQDWIEVPAAGLKVQVVASHEA